MHSLAFKVPPQEILTKDSVTVSVDAVVYFRIFNAVISGNYLIYKIPLVFVSIWIHFFIFNNFFKVINVEDAAKSTKLLAASTLRNVLGTKSLHEILSDRETVATLIQVWNK